PRQLVDTSLFAVDDADRGAADEAGLTEGQNRRNRCTSRGYDVLDEAYGLPRRERALESIAGSVTLCIFPHDQEGKSRLQRRGGRERDGAELGAGEPGCVRLVLAHRARDALAQRAQQLGPRFEAVLVGVVAG